MDIFSNKSHTNIMKIMIIGILAGIISGMFSAGGGLILVPIFVYLLKLSEKKARGTSLFCILPMVIVTAIMYSGGNYIDWKIGIKCAIGGTIGGSIGGKLLNKISKKYLQLSFILFLFYAGTSIILK